jgi:hypothetical protein
VTSGSAAMGAGPQTAFGGVAGCFSDTCQCLGPLVPACGCYLNCGCRPPCIDAAPGSGGEAGERTAGEAGALASGGAP